MSEWNENKLNAELQALMNDIPLQDDLEKKIEHGINKRIQKIALRTIIALTALVFVALLIINPAMNALYLNPYKLNQEPARTMLAVLRDYMETTYPYAEVSHLNVEKKGFASYNLEIQILDHSNYLTVGPPNVWVEFNRGHYENLEDPEGHMVKLYGRFESDYTKKEELISSLRELPASSIIYLSIGDSEIKAVDDLKKQDISLEWIQVYQPDVDFQGGLRMDMCCLWAEDDNRADMTNEELKQVYLSNLKNLLDNASIWRELRLFDGKYVYSDAEARLQETYENAKTLDTLKTNKYCISGKRDQLIAYLEHIETTSIHVDEVLLSSWN